MVDDNEKINQSQFYDLITGEELSWQSIIYDLVKTEQLDPWDIDIVILADKYLSIIQELEEANFFVSSKVLLACALILRLKSEILLNKHIQGLDEALYGKKEEKSYEYEKIEIDENELPILIPRTPMPRYKKVTLDELMSALNQAIETETRRIRKEIKQKRAEKSALVVLPKSDRIPLKDKIKNVYQKIRSFLSHPEKKHMMYSELAQTKEERLASFLPILHLSNQEKLFLEQENHFDEIFMSLEKSKKELEEISSELDEEIDESQFENLESDETADQITDRT
ncbi:MAG: segregation/condensation protein A [Nanoarchaeota archaeon]